MRDRDFRAIAREIPIKGKPLVRDQFFAFGRGCFPCRSLAKRIYGSIVIIFPEPIHRGGIRLSVSQGKYLVKLKFSKKFQY